MMEAVPELGSIPDLDSIPTAVVAAAGEQLVAGHLSALGLLVSVPRAHTPILDMVVTDPEGTRSAHVQVKTARSAYRERKREKAKEHWEFQINADRALERPREQLWYVLVDLCRWPHAKAPDSEPDAESLHIPEFLIVHASEIRSLLKDTGKWANLRIPRDGSERFWHRWDRIWQAVCGEHSQTRSLE